MQAKAGTKLLPQNRGRLNKLCRAAIAYSALLCVGYNAGIFFPFHPNFSALVTFLLWWSFTNVGGLYFSFGENHPFGSTTSCCGPGAPRWREDKKWDKAKHGNGGFCFCCIVLLRTEKILLLAGCHHHRPPSRPPPLHTTQTKANLEQGTNKDLGHQGLRGERQGTWIQSNDTQVKRQRTGSESWWLTEEGEDEKAKTMILSVPGRNIPAISQVITWCPEGTSQERCWGLVREWNTSL